MKKKIKDLTAIEIDDICDKHPLCKNCPFEAKDHSCYVLDKELWGELEIDYEQ